MLLTDVVVCDGPLWEECDGEVCKERFEFATRMGR